MAMNLMPRIISCLRNASTRMEQCNDRLQEVVVRAAIVQIGSGDWKMLEREDCCLYRNSNRRW